MAIKHFVPMVTHSFPVPTHLISICKWFSARKMLNKATDSSYHINMLVGSCLWGGTIYKYENGTLKVARNAFNIGVVWNPVCHVNKTVKLKLWSTFNRIILQRIKHFWYKLAEVSFFHHIWSKFAWLYDVITWLICIF